MVKRLLILLAVCLLLSACTGEGPNESGTTQSDSQTTEGTQTTQPGIYVPGSDVEQATGGAVRAYPLSGECTGMQAMGDGLLLFFRQEQGTHLLLLSGEQGRPVAEATISISLQPGDPGLAVSASGVGYYDQAADQVVFLNTALQEVSRIALPKDAVGMPVPAVSMEAFYYCTESQIRILELQTGISRLLRSQKAQYQGLRGSCFNGSVLICDVMTADGGSAVSFVCAEKGEELGQDAQVLAIQSARDHYFIRRAEGSVQELLFGSRDVSAQVLTLAREDEQISGVPSLNGAVGCIPGVDAQLRYYDLSSGKITASVSLPNMENLHGFTADAQANCVWFAAFDTGLQQDVLYRWTMADSPSGDDQVYTGPMYTADAPDTEGLEDCRTMAQRIETMFGVEVNIDLSDIPVPEGETLEAEFHVQAFHRGLIRLESIFTAFPENFFRILAEGRSSGKLHIGLVRSISSGVSALHYRVGSDAYIVLALGEGMEQEFYHELYYVIDSKVIGNSTIYDHWNSLNPHNFSYDYSYDYYADRTDSGYLKDDNRVFIDSFSMTYPKEDRARIFEYAMTPGNEAYFRSDTMKNKLSTLCRGIRDAFGLKKDPRVYPWEQYCS